MSRLVARRLSFSIGPTEVLRDVSLTVAPGRRTGLIGPNGAGKSTLLRLLAGELTPHRGQVERHPADVLVGHLHQEMVPAGDGTVAGHLAARTGVAAAATELAAATAEMADGGDGASPRYAAALEAWLGLGGADLPHRTDEVLELVGLGRIPGDQPASTLSGGQRARLDLAAVLLHRAPILLLDEPTNDLDLEGLALLEEHLMRPAAGFVVVSHDRALLARVVTHVVEIDDHSRTATEYAGGWDAYVYGRSRRRRRAEHEYALRHEQRARLVERARRQQEWQRRGMRAATTRPRDGDKNIRHARIARAQRTGARAARTAAELERLEPPDKPWEGWELRLDLAHAPRSGDVVARMQGALVCRGDFTLGPVDMELGAGDRVALVGPNGSGKSTLLAALLGRLPLKAGRRRLGPSVVVGELGQDRDAFPGDRTLIDAFVAATGSTAAEARSSLAKLGLGADDISRPARSLSAGERTRAVLAAFQVRGANLLVLDEPTNHLDLEAIEQLERALAGFAGTLVVVTHDRAFLEALAVDQVWSVEEGRWGGEQAGSR